MANDVSLETFNNNNEKSKIIANFVIGIVIIIAGIGLAGMGRNPVSLVFGLLMAGGGGYLIYLGYSLLVDVKNERKCKEGYFEQIFQDMRVPQSWIDGDVSVDKDYDIDEKSAVSKAQFNGYGGVFLVSNNEPESTGGLFDAYYIPGNTKAVLTKKSSIVTSDVKKKRFNLDAEGRTIATKLYIKAPAKTGNRVIAKDESGSKLEITSPIPPDTVYAQDACKTEV